MDTMTKPTLLLCPGTGYSATSPLYFSLASDNHYCHGGYDKEYKFLPIAYFEEVQDSKYDHYYHVQFRRMFDPKIKDGNIKLKGGIRTRPPKVFYTNSYVKFTEEKKEYLYSAPHTIDKYIEYYKSHYENIKGTYQAVSDFSTDNANLPLWYLKKIAPQLKEHFNIKVLLIFRDPIRRLFSEVNKCFYNNDTNFWSARDMFLHILKNPTDIPGLHRQYENPNILTYYRDVIHNYRECFEDVHISVMEDMWVSRAELERLSDFISYKIPKLHENVYWPPMGSKAPHYKYLADQWMSDREDLRTGDANKAKKLMKSVYDDWKLQVGTLSKHWI